MKLELEVLASTSIRRKKPWPRLAWIGQVSFAENSLPYLPALSDPVKSPRLKYVYHNIIKKNWGLFKKKQNNTCTVRSAYFD